MASIIRKFSWPFSKPSESKHLTTDAQNAKLHEGSKRSYKSTPKLNAASQIVNEFLSRIRTPRLRKKMPSCHQSKGRNESIRKQKPDITVDNPLYIPLEQASAPALHAQSQLVERKPVPRPRTKFFTTNPSHVVTIKERPLKQSKCPGAELMLCHTNQEARFKKHEVIDPCPEILEERPDTSNTTRKYKSNNSERRDSKDKAVQSTNVVFRNTGTNSANKLESGSLAHSAIDFQDQRLRTKEIVELRKDESCQHSSDECPEVNKLLQYSDCSSLEDLLTLEECFRQNLLITDEIRLSESSNSSQDEECMSTGSETERSNSFRFKTLPLPPANKSSMLRSERPVPLPRKSLMKQMQSLI